MKPPRYRNSPGIDFWDTTIGENNDSKAEQATWQQKKTRASKRSSDRASIERAIKRAIERAIERSSGRAIEQAIERASDRAIERASDRAIEGSSNTRVHARTRVYAYSCTSFGDHLGIIWRSFGDYLGAIVPQEKQGGLEAARLNSKVFVYRSFQKLKSFVQKIQNPLNSFSGAKHRSRKPQIPYSA